MKMFVRNIGLFMSPILLVIMCIMPFYIVGVQSGEFDTIKHNIVKQRNDHTVLLGMGYNEETRYYKLLNANYYKADVLALGTSRVMQFRDDFFSETFYNCGGVVSGNYNEYINFLENLAYKPNTVIVGLDAWVFNIEWSSACVNYDKYIEINENKRNKIAMLKTMALDWKKGKWKFSTINCYPHNIGFNGRIKNEGFMYDGSYYYGDVYRNPQKQDDWEFASTLKRIAEGENRFEYGDHISVETMVQLENFLKYCKENNIYVIGFLAPFAPSIYDAMHESGNYKYLDEISPACMLLFDKYDYGYYDYADGSILGVSDEYFVDGFHGGDIVYGYILLDIASNDDAFSIKVDVKNIEYLIENRANELTIWNKDGQK